jgi:hypothetical protein
LAITKIKTGMPMRHLLLAAFALPLLLHAPAHAAGPANTADGKKPITLLVLEECTVPDKVDDSVFAITCGKKTGLLRMATTVGSRTQMQWETKPSGLITSMARRYKALVVKQDIKQEEKTPDKLLNNLAAP